MRTTARLGSLVLAASLIGGCGTEEAEAEAPLPEVAQQVPTAVAIEAPPPAHGGTVVAAGNQFVEVVPHEDGNVRAFVVTPEPPPPDQTQITVRMPGSDGSTHPVVLTYDPDEQLYAGRLRRVQPVAGPLEVVVVVGPQRYEGSAPHFVLVAPPQPTVVVERPDPRPATVVVERPDPRPTIVVERPDPRPTIVVERPAPPTIVVEHPSRPTIVVERPSRPTIVVERPSRPTIVVQRPDPRPVVVVERPSPRRTVIVERPGPRVRVHSDNGRHLGHRRGHGHGHGRH